MVPIERVEHEQTIEWIIDLWLAIHGGDPELGRIARGALVYSLTTAERSDAALRGAVVSDMKAAVEALAQRK